MRSIRKFTPALLVGMLAVSGAYVGAKELSSRPSAEVTLTQDSTGPESAPPGSQAPAGKPGHPGRRAAIRGEIVVQGDGAGQFETVKFDRGVLTAVDGSMLSIEEPDGTKVDIATSSETKIARDGQQSSIGDLVVGDHIFARQTKSGDTYTTVGVRAMSPERYAQFEQRRDNMRGRMQQRRARRQAGAGAGVEGSA